MSGLTRRTHELRIKKRHRKVRVLGNAPVEEGCHAGGYDTHENDAGYNTDEDNDDQVEKVLAKRRAGAEKTRQLFERSKAAGSTGLKISMGKYGNRTRQRNAQMRKTGHYVEPNITKLMAINDASITSTKSTLPGPVNNVDKPKDKSKRKPSDM
jgi:hypothetical protein